MDLVKTPRDETSTPTGSLSILLGLGFPPIPEFNNVA
jgi:hypothetical protein